VWVWLKDPPDLPTAFMAVVADVLPIGILLAVLKSGKLKVVEPSPAPKAVPITLNSVEYVVLETAAPLHNNIFVGIVVPTKGTTAPTGKPVPPLLNALVAD
jgi:hypothetical protein